MGHDARQAPRQSAAYPAPRRPGFQRNVVLRRFTAPLEANFTLVYWDQRGAGKSFSRKIPKSSMSVAQFIADLDELVDRVRERLGHDKVAVFGHSWGSVLGVLYAARFPEKVSAYVGCEQIGDWPAAEAASYAYALGKAQRLGNAKAMADLRRIGPPPYSARSLFKERMWLQRLDGQLSAKALWNMGRIVLGCPETAVVDVPNAMRGFRFTVDAMWDEVSRLNLLERVPQLRMPVFFFFGRRDHWVPPGRALPISRRCTRRPRSSCGSSSPDTSRSSMNRPDSTQRWPSW